jgi:hypothetical protein
MRSFSTPAVDLRAPPSVHTSDVAVAGSYAAAPFAAGRARDAASPGRAGLNALPADPSNCLQQAAR